MVKNLKDHLEKTLERLEVGDIDGAKLSLKVVLAWFVGMDDEKYLARVMYESMGEWSEIKEGLINTSKLASVLRESGLMREDGE